MVLSVLLLSRFKNQDPPKDRMVRIHTAYGDITVKLYNETPKHRDNIIALADSGFYDSLLFHRVMNAFMIQGGDPESKDAKPGARLGNGGPGYTLEAEFVSGLFHKKGALAAARQPDNVNPAKASSGSQFYLVQGQVFTPEMLVSMEAQMNQRAMQKAMQAHFDNPANLDDRKALQTAQQAGDQASFDSILTAVQGTIQLDDSFAFSEEQKELYSTLGGTPHLDGEYTVFGEVTEGLNIIDSIAAVSVDRSNRPTEDVWMTIEVIR
jgi:cyclophilin family peptidyl-prolyl cis-trans isomerase